MKNWLAGLVGHKSPECKAYGKSAAHAPEIIAYKVVEG